MPLSQRPPALALIVGLAFPPVLGAGLGAAAQTAPANPPAQAQPAQTQNRPQGQQQQQRRPQGQQQQQSPQQQRRPQALPSRIPPPGPAEVPLFPARDYADQRSGLRLTVPAGWVVIEVPQVPEGEISRLYMEGPGMPAPNCSIVVIRPQQPANITQAQLNRAIHDDSSVNAVRQQLGQQGRRVVAHQKQTLGGVAGLSAQVQIPGGTWMPEMTTFVSFFEQVGKRFSVNCNVLTLDLDAMRPDVDAVLKSLRFQSS